MMKPENPVEPFKRAVTAAVRAIARDSELSVNFGAEGTATGGGRNRLPTPSRELGGEEVAHVRGSGDALALWHRHHDNRLHALNQPKGATARAVFEAAEQARVESIGSKRMMGVSDNLDAMLEERCRARGYASVKDPGEALLPEVVAMLVREQLTGKEPPAAAKAMVEHIRPWVEEKAGDDLRNLTGNISDQRCGRWSRIGGGFAGRVRAATSGDAGTRHGFAESSGRKLCDGWCGAADPGYAGTPSADARSWYWRAGVWSCRGIAERSRGAGYGDEDRGKAQGEISARERGLEYREVVVCDKIVQ